VFSRWSWNDGHNEIMAFADIDRSLSGGVSIKGKSWGRAKDTIGIGGALNYRTECILESYYSLALLDTTWLTFDYQFITNPAYNADRGPVSIFSARLHAEF
jgi:high affinity Mn2+ porin